MTSNTVNLAQLTRERDEALAHIKDDVQGISTRIRGIDDDVKEFATRHPVIAVGGATAAGVGAGIYFPFYPFGRLLKGYSMAIIGPLAAELLERVTRIARAVSHGAPDA